ISPMARKTPNGDKRSSAQEPILPGVNPAVEDHATPERSVPFPVVAVGASAGGLKAFDQLLAALSPATDMAFVFVLHLDPKHASSLAEILARATKMRVTQVAHNMAV